jgi:hypothetical protein
MMIMFRTSFGKACKITEIEEKFHGHLLSQRCSESSSFSEKKICQINVEETDNAGQVWWEQTEKKARPHRCAVCL